MTDHPVTSVPAGTVIVLAGPKGVGKSWGAGILAASFDVYHVDPDPLILEWSNLGGEPDPQDGWLSQIRDAVVSALREHPAVSVEMTGAWESDYKLCDQLEKLGHRVIRTSRIAPVDETIDRVQLRTGGWVPTTELEARAIFKSAAARGQNEEWDAVVDTSGPPDAGRIIETYVSLLRR
jgi:hypothetical protein